MLFCEIRPWSREAQDGVGGLPEPVVRAGDKVWRGLEIGRAYPELISTSCFSSDLEQSFLPEEKSPAKLYLCPEKNEASIS